MAIKLTENAILTMKTTNLKPLVQIIDLKPVNTSTERFRFVISDGVFHHQGMLATQLNDLVKSGKLQKGSIVQLADFTCGIVWNRLIIIVVSLIVMLEQGDLIDDPSQFPPNTDV